MPLFHVQDNDRPMYVVADNWQDAISRWQKVIEEENEGCAAEQPTGIVFVCTDNDLITDRVHEA